MKLASGKSVVTLLASILVFIPLVLADVQILNITTDLYPTLSSTCIAVLNQAVACDTAVLWAGRGRFEDDATLTTLCTSTCSTSLATWHRRVIQSCKDRVYNGGGYFVLPQLWSVQYLDEYGLICLQHNGLFCNAVIRDKAGMNAVNQKATATPVSTLACEDCAIKFLSAKQQLQLQSKADVATAYSSLTSSCKKTAFPITSITTTIYSISATTSIPSNQPTRPSALPTNSPCTGSSYIIKSTDTCQSISKANGISTEGMLRTNNLAPYCKMFPSSGKSICIDTKHKCKTYTVKSGDSCGSIGDSLSPALSWTQVVTWNPELDPGCSKVQSYVGYEICVERPGGNWVNPIPDEDPVTTSSTLEPSRTGTPVHLLPQATYASTGNHTSWVFANGTRRDCERYVTGAEMLGNNTCAQVAAAFDVNLENELKLWNPSLASASPCTLKLDEEYCAQRTLHKAANITEYCVLRNYAAPGTTLKGFISSLGIELDQFFAWNPTVNSDGSGYKTERITPAVGPPNPEVNNERPVRLHYAGSEQTCEIIETKFGLSHSRFVAWNPAVLSTCRGIVAGYDYCVSIPNYKPVYTTPIPVTIPPQDTTIYSAPTYSPIPRPSSSTTTSRRN